MSDHRSIVLDNWRGWAILFVLVGHFLPVPGVNLGRAGVELFFVLSGRLMAELLFIRRTPLPRFFYRRFTRVVPVSLLFLVTVLVIFPPGVDHLRPKPALASALMALNYTRLVGIGASVVEHYWSLCIEEHSYLVLGSIAWLLAHRSRGPGAWPAAICLAIAAAMVVNGWRLTHAGLDYYQAYWRTDVRGATIFMSVALRVLLARGAAGAAHARWVAPAALVLGLALNADAVPDPVKYSLGSLLLALSINTLDHAPAAMRRLLASRIVAWFGLVSFSVYIWQQPFYLLADQYGGVPMLAGAIATGAAISYLYEHPLREWLNGLRTRRATLALAK